MARWYLLRPGSKKPEGPFSTEELQRSRGLGELEPGSRIAEVGSQHWMPWEDVDALAPEGAPARPPAAPPTAAAGPSTLSPRWAQAATVLLGLLLIEGAALAYLVAERMAHLEAEHRTWLTQELQNDRGERATERQRSQAREVGTPRPLAAFNHGCVATMSEVTCVLTNLTEETIGTCVQGLIQQKDAAGVRLYSKPMCSGPVQPRTTVTKASYWDGGRAIDLCKDARGFLDWDKCDFTAIDFDPGKAK